MTRSSRILPLFLGATLLGGCGYEAPDESAAQEVIDQAVQTDGTEASLPVSAAAAYCDDVSVWSSSWTTLENEVLTLVNQRRAAGAVCGGVAKPPAPALTLDSRLRCAARKHSKDMGVNNFFSHTGSNGSTPWQRMNLAGYTYSYAAENIGAGYGTAKAAVDGWMASTGHCNNIMNPNLRQLGVGYYYSANSTYRHYWTQDFGTP